MLSKLELGLIVAVLEVGGWSANNMSRSGACDLPADGCAGVESLLAKSSKSMAAVCGCCCWWICVTAGGGVGVGVVVGGVAALGGGECAGVGAVNVRLLAGAAAPTPANNELANFSLADVGLLVAAVNADLPAVDALADELFCETGGLPSGVCGGGTIIELLLALRSCDGFAVRVGRDGCC